jgi:hypothetical protein
VQLIGNKYEPNIPRNIAGNFCPVIGGTRVNLRAVPTASFLLCSLSFTWARVPRDMKNSFRGSSVERRLGNTDKGGKFTAFRDVSKVIYVLRAANTGQIHGCQTVVGVEEGNSQTVVGVEEGNSQTVVGVEEGNSQTVVGVEEGNSQTVVGVEEGNS